MNIQIIKGSNKDLQINGSTLTFHFSDRFSLFDFGPFPFELRGKGEAQKIFSTSVDKFIKNFINTAFKSYEPLTQTFFDKNKFIPLEFIFRLGVVPGSSYLKRNPEIIPYTRFPEPIIETSTKLEDVDRLLSFQEAQKLSPHPIEKLFYEIMPKLSLNLQSFFQNAGMELWDGKFEFAFDNGQYLLIDAVTQDELRYTFKGFECSKELIRKPYRETLWFKHGMNESPPVLTSKMQSVISDIYLFSAKLLQDKSYATKLEESLREYEENLWLAF